jgi:acyl carrier protein
MPIDWPKWGARYPEALSVPFLSEFANEAQGHDAPRASESDIRAAVVACTSRDAALQLLQTYLRSDAAKILRIPEERLNIGVSLVRFGLDSLMAVELKNRIDSEFNVRTPTAKLLQGPSVSDLADWLIGEISAAIAADVAPADAAVATVTNVAPDVDAMSDDEVNAMLGKLLAEGGRG